MASIIDRITALWRGSNQAAEVVTAPPTPPTMPSWVSFDTTGSDRRTQVQDCRAMYDEDPRASQAMATLARDATKGGFAVQVTGARAADALRVADELIIRLDLFTRLDDWLRLTQRDGDSFLEVGVAADNTIVQVTRKPTLEMYRASDERDAFADPAKAFFWTDQAVFNPQLAPLGATWFAAWQIIQARWGRDEGSRYGRPLFASARKAYKRMSQGELDIAVRRKTRSGLKYVHTLEDASPADIEAYKAANKPALDDPFAAAVDFFTNKRGGIQIVQGDAHLSEIEDVLHHVDTFGLASPVPLELIGYGRNLNRDVLEQKKAQYEETIGAVRMWLVAEIIKPLLELQWLLLGIWPDALTWDVQWKAKKQPTPTDLAEMARFAATVKAAGLLTDATLLSILATVLPDFDVEAELTAIETDAAAREEMAMRIAGNAQVPADDNADDAPADKAVK